MYKLYDMGHMIRREKLTQAPMVSSWRPIQYQSPDPDEDAEIALYVA